MPTATSVYFRTRDLHALLTLEEALSANDRQFLLFASLGFLGLLSGTLLAVLLPQLLQTGLLVLILSLTGILASWLRYQFRQEVLLQEVQLLTA